MKMSVFFSCCFIFLLTSCKPEAGKFEGSWKDIKTGDKMTITHQGDTFKVALSKMIYTGTGWNSLSDSLFLYAGDRIRMGYDKKTDHIIRVDKLEKQEFERVGQN